MSSNNGSGGYQVFSVIVTVLAIIGAIILISAFVKTSGFIGIFTGLAAIIIVICFFGVIFGGW